MQEQFSRTAMLLGESAIDKLKNARVAIFGLGGVGGYALEALCRSGIGTLHLIDSDTLSVSNINRQILATHDTVGMLKVEAAKARVRAINPNCQVFTYPIFFTPETADALDFSQFDYVIDALDPVTGKLCLIEKAADAGIPVISCMGTGNRLDASALRVMDISKTSNCGLARVMRKELRKGGIHHLKVVCSLEEPLTPVGGEEEAAALGKRQIPGSNAFVPGAAGLLLAGEVIRDLTK